MRIYLVMLFIPVLLCGCTGKHADCKALAARISNQEMRLYLEHWVDVNVHTALSKELIKATGGGGPGD